jgi:exopolysaccharide biosynthesis polyprenyl glycosylphosphotransferase
LTDEQLKPSSIDRARFIANAQAGRTPVSRAAKRILDIALSLLLVVGLAPMLLLVAALIKLESRGPVFYRQTRVGLDGAPFSILKFRSMRKDAEKDGPNWARIGDDRVTRVGRYIRKLRIDEIPQAFNILAGRMSFVGPRPERPEFVSELEELIHNYDLRHLEKPGLSGWAQVKFDYGASVPDAYRKLTYDLYYIENRSFWFDCRIALMTLRVAFLGVGAR